MIKSMTGYGRIQATVNNKDILVEIKSVNHRFLDINCRVPRIYGFLEDKIRFILQKQINRGKVDVYVSVINCDDNGIEVKLDKALLEGYISAMRTISEDYGITNDISVSSISKFSDIFGIKKIEEDNQLIWESVQQVLDNALSDYMDMRAFEGEKLKDALADMCANIKIEVDKIQERSPVSVEEYRKKITLRVSELLGESEIDEAKIIYETSCFADKVAVDEEIVRLRSHISQFEKLLGDKNPVGKKMDFIIQEMNREINTIGSKASDITLSKIVVEVKAEIEKMREQIQNIE